MANRIEHKSVTFDCSKCNRRVVFIVEEINFTSDEGELPITPSIGDVLSYGNCQVAQDAAVPGHPVLTEIVNCPFLNEHR